MKCLAPLAALGLLTLGGCASFQGNVSTPSLTATEAQKTVYATRLGFNAALTAAVAYASRPRCAPAAPIICSDANVVAQMRLAAAAADASITSAENGVMALGTTPDALQASIVAAASALDAYKKVVAIYTPAK